MLKELLSFILYCSRRTNCSFHKIVCLPFSFFYNRPFVNTCVCRLSRATHSKGDLVSLNFEVNSKHRATIDFINLFMSVLDVCDASSDTIFTMKKDLGIANEVQEPIIC